MDSLFTFIGSILSAFVLGLLSPLFYMRYLQSRADERLSNLETDIGLRGVEPRMRGAKADLRVIERLDGLDKQLRRVENSTEHLSTRAVETALMNDRLAILEEAAGGQWKTANGDVVNIRDMDRSHIRNCLNGGFAKGKSRKNMLDELKRRQVGAQFRARDLGDEITALGGDLKHGAAGPPESVKSMAKGKKTYTSCPSNWYLRGPIGWPVSNGPNYREAGPDVGDGPDGY
jgi:hypothetical protein